LYHQTITTMENTKAKNIAREMSYFVNSYSSDHKEFINEMGKDHRTLQQSFTKLCLKWIEFVGSDDYRHDLRNQDSHEVCQKMIATFRRDNDNWKPSDFLRMI
jgi:hypothetical protein